MKSEKNYPFTLFEKWKVKWFFLSLFSRSESEIEIPRDRDREVKFQNNSREFSRNETLAGYCTSALEGWRWGKDTPTSLRSPLLKLLVVWTNGRTYNLMLWSQNLSYMLSHWCRPLGLTSHAVQEVLCIKWFKITYFQEYLERSWGVLAIRH